MKRPKPASKRKVKAPSKRRRGKTRAPQTPIELGTARPLVYTLKEFCSAARTSRSKLYELMKQGKGPKFLPGHRKRLTGAAAEEWLNQQQASCEQA